MRNLDRRVGRRGLRPIGRVVLAGAVAAAVVMALAAPSMASAGTIGPSHPSTGWAGKTFTAGATPSPAACTSVTCDYFTLDVAVPSSYWATHTGHATVSICWGDASDNFALYVSRAGGSAQSSSTSEAVSITDPSGSYSVTVVPKLVTASGYSGAASFSAATKPQPNPTGGGGSGSSGSGSGSGGSGGGSGSGGSGGGSGSGGSGGGASGGGSGSGGSGGGGGTGRSGGGASGGGSGSTNVPIPITYHPGPTVVGGSSSQGGLFPVPSAGIFHYTGPYHFTPPFTFGGKGKLHPVSSKAQRPAPQPQANSANNPGGTTSVSKGNQPARPARIVAAPASSSPGTIPSIVWILIPVVLIIIAAAGAVSMEPARVSRGRPGQASPPRSSDRPVVMVPPGPLVLLGFAVRRLARAVLNVAGNLFGGAEERSS